MKISVKAPAKVNLTLEVLGRRTDGYHEIRTILQTIDLCDMVTLERADDVSLEQAGDQTIVPEDNLALRAAQLLRDASHSQLGARMRLYKSIPIAAGLGGGSSDAAATLRGLNKLWNLKISVEELSELGAQLGSDVPFFLYGGIALAEGRGEVITHLPDTSPRWLVLVAPTLEVPSKTTTLYGQLKSGDYSDGSTTTQLAKAIQRGDVLNKERLVNAFERAALVTFPGLRDYWEALADAAGRPVHLSGAGPSIFTLAPNEGAARSVVQKLQERVSARLFAVPTISSEAATEISVSEA